MGGLAIVFLILKILLWSLTAVFALCVLLLILPVFYRADIRMQKQDKTEFTVKGRGFILLGILAVTVSYPSKRPVIIRFLGIPFRIRINEKKTDSPKKKEQDKSKAPSQKVPVIDRIKSVLHILSMDASKEAILRGREKILKLLSHLLPDKLYGDVSFGMEDPSDTGEILGILCALRALFSWNLTLDPVFDKEYLDGKVTCKGKVIPVLLIMDALQIMTDRRIKGFVRRIQKGLKNGR